MTVLKLNHQLAPGISDWDALGIESVADFLMGGSPPKHAEELSVDLANDRGCERWRAPLPGTVLESGRRNGKPRGAGTGWLRITRWQRPPLGQLLRARFTNPPSQSLAEREWNLHCALRAAGISTPEPLAVASATGHLATRRSFLITRELEGSAPLPEWLEQFDSLDHRRQLSRALGLFIGRLAAAGARLPLLRWDAIVAHQKSGGRSDCAAERISDLQPQSPIRKFALSGLPELALADLRGGGLGAALSPHERFNLLLQLVRSTPSGSPIVSQVRAVELVRAIHALLGDVASETEKRRLVREFVRDLLREVGPRA